MGIEVRLIWESGERVVESIVDRDDFIARCARERDGWRLLYYIDEYGDTDFNTLQVPDFQADWDAAQTLIRSPEEDSFWHQLRRLARDAREEPGLHLKFLGD